jgi:hypothetical protein
VVLLAIVATIDRTVNRPEPTATLFIPFLQQFFLILIDAADLRWTLSQ